jgi:hypothetical protein
MSRHFHTDAIGPFAKGQRDNLQRGYDSLIYDLREAESECQAMLSLVERRIEDREINCLYDGPSDLDPEHQAFLDRYYRSEQEKLRWLVRLLRSVVDTAQNPARDPLESKIKVVSIR